MSISEKARGLIGHKVTYHGPRGGTTVGIVKDVRRAPGVIVNPETNETWPAIEFLINGRWRGTFPDDGAASGGEQK